MNLYIDSGCHAIHVCVLYSLKITRIIINSPISNIVKIVQKTHLIGIS
jgi:hypothetical protein